MDATRTLTGSSIVNDPAGATPDRIIIIDDNPSVHDAFRTVLQREPAGDAGSGQTHATSSVDSPPTAARGRSFSLDFAYSGEEGLRLVSIGAQRQQPYAVAFVDLRMPSGWDGVETIRRLWRQCPELQAVLCTGFSDYSWESLLESLGDTDRMLILHKPFERDEVLQLAHMLTRKWHRERQLQPIPSPTPDEPFRLLILEDEIVTSTILQRKLTAAFPNITLLPAKTVAEAQALLSQNTIEFFLLDIFLPDGTGIDFLFHVMAVQPNACAVLMTGQALGEYRNVAEQLGVLDFLEKPIKIPKLTSLIQRRVDAKNSAAQGNACFAATLTRLTTIDIIQLKCLAKATATLDFVRRDGLQGRVWFETGEIVHAEVDHHSGETAFAQVVGWRDGRVVEVASSPIPKRTINIPWQTLLLNTAHQVDEKSAAP